MKDNFVCIDNCFYNCDCCPTYGYCFFCEHLDTDYCKNCYYLDEEYNLEFYEERGLIDD